MTPVSLFLPLNVSSEFNIASTANNNSSSYTIDDIAALSARMQNIQGLMKTWNGPETLHDDLTYTAETIKSMVVWHEALTRSGRSSGLQSQPGCNLKTLRATFVDTVSEYQLACARNGQECMLPLGWQIPALQQTLRGQMSAGTMVGIALNSLLKQYDRETAVVGSTGTAENQKKILRTMTSQHRLTSEQQGVDSGLDARSLHECSVHEEYERIRRSRGKKT